MIRVLVADDDADILQIVEVVLALKGFEVKPVSRGEDILQEAAAFKPDVILLDVNLSGQDGMRICKELKSHLHGFRHIPVILFSAMYNLTEKLSECGADDFLAKPFDNDQLVDIILKHAMEPFDNKAGKRNNNIE